MQNYAFFWDLSEELTVNIAAIQRISWDKRPSGGLCAWLYQAQQKECYLTDDQVLHLQLGLKAYDKFIGR